MHSSSIYIVEDELLISENLKYQLQYSGYMVSGSASRGETCIEEIQELSAQGNEPEIVLMDIHLRGDLDGIETARILSDRFNCAIIFLTGQSSKEVYERSFSIKPFGYLLKPIDMDQTRMTIEIAAYQRTLEIKNKACMHDLESLLQQRTEKIKELVTIYETVVDHSVIGLTIIQDDRFVFANDRIAEIFGYPPEIFRKLCVQELSENIHPGYRSRMSEFSKTRLERTDLPNKTEFKIITPAGQEKRIETYTSVVQFKGKAALHQTTIDITDY